MTTFVVSVVDVTSVFPLLVLTRAVTFGVILASAAVVLKSIVVM